MGNINIQERISEAKYYISLGKTDDALEQLLPVLVYLQIPHSIVDQIYVIDEITRIIISDGFDRLESFLKHIDVRSSYHLLNEHGCLEPVRMDYVKDLVKIIEERGIVHYHE